MEAIFSNPGYHLISENILSTLDHETLMSCKEALHHRTTILSDPTFWIKKCFDLGLQYDLFFHWKQLIQITTGTSMYFFKLARSFGHQKLIRCVLCSNIRLSDFTY